MKKNDWIYLAKMLCGNIQKNTKEELVNYSKQLIKEVNKNKEVMIDDDEKLARLLEASEFMTPLGGNIPFKGNGNF